jgi:hypothetical protein
MNEGQYECFEKQDRKKNMVFLWMLGTLLIRRSWQANFGIDIEDFMVNVT